MCGTTSLSAQLFNEWGFTRGLAFRKEANNDLFSNEKEHHFFETPARSRWSRGLEHYAESFPPCGVATLDATPNYAFLNRRNAVLHFEETADRLAEMYGDWRMARSTFVFLLCDPIKRAQSAFCEHTRTLLVIA